MVTSLQLKKICPNMRNPDLWVPLLNSAFELNEFSSVDQAMFIAQCAHESGEFNTLSENLNYSAERLLVIFPKYFKADTVQKFNRNPQAIANTVYANRMGNGDFASGDGFKYAGRGLIMLTGKDAYRKFSIDTYGDEKILLNNPETLREPAIAIKSAMWFWKKNHIKSCGSVVTCATKKINGGLNGISSRVEYFNKAMQIL